MRPVESPWIRGLVVFLALGVALYVTAVVWAGSETTLRSIEAIGIVALGIGTLASVSSYLFRFARWQFILSRLGHSPPIVFSFRVYLAGLALTTSPAKLGETLRSALLLPCGVPLPHSLAAFFADRLGDVLGVAVLGAVAGWIAGNAQPVLEGIATFVFVLSIVAAIVFRSAWWSRLLLGSSREKRLRRLMVGIVALGSAWAQVWSASRSLYYALAAVVAFGIQGFVFAAFVKVVAPWMDPLASVTIYASSTLIGAASMMPAGLGAVEAAMVVQLTTRGVPTPEALAAVIAARVATLWFGMIIGAVMLLGLASGHSHCGKTATRRPE